MAVAKYLSKYFIEKYENEAIFATSQCGLPVRISKNPQSVASMDDDGNITLTILRIICNYIRYEFGKHDILPGKTVHNVGSGYIQTEYGTHNDEN